MVHRLQHLNESLFIYCITGDHIFKIEYVSASLMACHQGPFPVTRNDMMLTALLPRLPAFLQPLCGLSRNKSVFGPHKRAYMSYMIVNIVIYAI